MLATCCLVGLLVASVTAKLEAPGLIPRMDKFLYQEFLSSSHGVLYLVSGNKVKHKWQNVDVKLDTSLPNPLEIKGMTLWNYFGISRNLC